MGDNFKSFRDLKRSLGGESDGTPQEEAPRTREEERGWTLDTGDDGQGPDFEPLLESSARERISRRPPGFGPMDTGPPAYADPDSDELRLLESFRIRTLFPPDVLEEAKSLPADPRPEDFEGREDLRGWTIFTIDGADAKDFDDAISIEPLEDGAVLLGVHIADVGHYVRPGTALDAEALARGTSVYLPDQVVPMLPEELSNGLCSLVPDRDRLAFSVLMTFDADGKRTHARVTKSIIRSKKRNTYRVVQELLDGKQSDEVEAIRHLEEPLRMFQKWTRRQQAIRDAKGSLRIQSRERKFVFDEKHEVSGVIEDPRYFSNALIEETALAANQAVGDLFRSRGLPTIYRVHPEKDQEEIEAVAKMLGEHGIRVPTKERLTGRDIGRLIRAARNKRNADVLIMRIMGLVERAFYEVRDHQDVAEHFGLAREAYLHFTSPIRRYPDLIVHRWLHSIESRGEEAERELGADEMVADLNEMANHSSMQADVAGMTQQAIEDLKVCQYLEPHIDEKFEATVLRVSPGGMEVMLDPYGVSGFLPVRSMGEKGRVEGPNLTVRAGRKSLSFTEGHPVRIRIREVDFLRLQVMLELA